MGLRAADAIYKEGLHWTRIQGDECTDTLYKVGKPNSITQQGEPFTGTAANKTETRTYKKRGDAYGYNLYRVSSHPVTPVGTPVKNTYSTLYYYDQGEYRAISNISSMYFAGTQTTYYTLTQTINANTLYYSGGDETVTVITDEYTGGYLYYGGSPVPYTEQGEMYEGSLYYPGTEYSGGLYTNFQLAQLTTQDVTALTV